MENRKMIYLVEDDESIRELVIYTLKSQGFEAKGFERPSHFWKALEKEKPALLLLDVMLPEEDGISILKKLRMRPDTRKLPIIMLTAKSSEYDTVVGLDSGADDYIPKPFRMMELISRIRALLRRTEDDGAEEYCLCTPDAEAAAKEAGADYVGLDEYVEKIKGGWTDIDVIITMPSCMGKIGPLGRVLGPRGLMPNPKSGTVTMDVAKAVKEVKQGKIDFKVDKAGIIHTSIGKVSMTPEQIYGNAKEFINTVIKLKPAAAKGTYIKSIFISSTMSKGIKIDPKSVE